MPDFEKRESITLEALFDFGTHPDINLASEISGEPTISVYTSFQEVIHTVQLLEGQQVTVKVVDLADSSNNSDVQWEAQSTGSVNVVLQTGKDAIPLGDEDLEYTESQIPRANRQAIIIKMDKGILGKTYTVRVRTGQSEGQDMVLDKTVLIVPD